MAHHPALRAKAIELRTRERFSIDEIAVRLALPRTTVYAWVRDLPLGRASRNNPHPGTRRMQAIFHQRRNAAYKRGVTEFTALCAADATFRDFVCMYVGEGSKRNRNRVAICNSNPRVVVLAHRWMRRFARNPLTYGVQHHADQSLVALVAYWSATLGVPAEAIVLQRKSNSGGLNGRRWRSRHGVLTITANDTLLRARLQGWIDCLVNQWT